MPCEDDRPLTQTERAAGFRQQRTGVPQAVRPYQGPIPPGMQALIDYLNRELIPAVRQTRNAVNEVYLPAVDNAPSANPLGYYFSTETAAADPTAGRLRLDQAVQNTSTTLLVSEENGRLQDVGVFLDIMAGSATVPLGVVTLVDSINPGRYIRFDLNAITDQGDYWELDVDPTESSHDNPFVDGEAVILAFMPGVGSTPATVPIGVIAPALAGAAGDGLVWDAGNLEFDVGAGDGIDVAADSVAVDVTDIVDNVSITEVATNNIQRAALTGAIAATAGSNATLFAGIRDNGAAETDRTNLNFVSSTSATAVVTDDAGNDELEVTYQRAALTGAIAASANANATLFAGIRDNGSAETDRTNLNFVSGTGTTAVVTDDAGNDELEIAFNLANMAGGTVKGRQVDAGTGAPVDLTGAEVGELVRWSTSVAPTDDGDMGSTSLTVAADITAINFNPASDLVRVHGITGGVEGRIILYRAAASTIRVEFVSEDTSITAAERLLCPGDRDVIATNNRSWGVLYYLGSRWRVIPASQDVPRVTTITPSAIGSNQNNYNPTGWATANFVRLSATGSVRDITGAEAGEDGEIKYLANVGTIDIALQHENASSTAANRFRFASLTVFTIQPEGVAGLWYDGTSDRWRVLYHRL